MKKQLSRYLIGIVLCIGMLACSNMTSDITGPESVNDLTGSSFKGMNSAATLQSVVIDGNFSDNGNAVIGYYYNGSNGHAAFENVSNIPNYIGTEAKLVSKFLYFGPSGKKHAGWTDHSNAADIDFFDRQYISDNHSSGAIVRITTKGFGGGLNFNRDAIAVGADADVANHHQGHNDALVMELGSRVRLSGQTISGVRLVFEDKGTNGIQLTFSNDNGNQEVVVIDRAAIDALPIVKEGNKPDRQVQVTGLQGDYTKVMLDNVGRVDTKTKTDNNSGFGVLAGTEIILSAPFAGLANQQAFFFQSGTQGKIGFVANSANQNSWEIDKIWDQVIGNENGSFRRGGLSKDGIQQNVEGYVPSSVKAVETNFKRRYFWYNNQGFQNRQYFQKSERVAAGTGNNGKNKDRQITDNLNGVWAENGLNSVVYVNAVGGQANANGNNLGVDSGDGWPNNWKVSGNEELRIKLGSLASGANITAVNARVRGQQNGKVMLYGYDAAGNGTVITTFDVQKNTNVVLSSVINSTQIVEIGLKGAQGGSFVLIQDENGSPLLVLNETISDGGFLGEEQGADEGFQSELGLVEVCATTGFSRIQLSSPENWTPYSFTFGSFAASFDLTPTSRGAGENSFLQFPQSTEVTTNQGLINEVLPLINEECVGLPAASMSDVSLSARVVSNSSGNILINGYNLCRITYTGSPATVQVADGPNGSFTLVLESGTTYFLSKQSAKVTYSDGSQNIK